MFSHAFTRATADLGSLYSPNLGVLAALVVRRQLERVEDLLVLGVEGAAVARPDDLQALLRQLEPVLVVQHQLQRAYLSLLLLF